MEKTFPRSILLIIAHTCCYMSITRASAETIKIGIIGGGIGGTSSAFFLRELFDDDANIHLFEMSTVGGRLATVEMNNRHYESGGSIVHPRNKYMVEFLQKFGHEKRVAMDGGAFGLFDGKHFAFTESSYNMMTVLQLFYRYGIDPYWLQKSTHILLEEFSKIYEHQKNGFAFTTLEHMLNSMSPKFVEKMNVTLKSSMLQEGYSEKFIDELVNAIVRVNYGQSTEVHGFVGAVAVAGAQPDLWAVHGGNKLIPESLLRAATVQGFHHCQVKSVTKVDTKNFKMRCVDENNNEEMFEDFDYIIIAAPIADELRFENFTESATPSDTQLMPYHRLTATFVNGTLNHEFMFSDIASEILSINDSLFFNSIGRNLPVDYNSSGNDANFNHHYSSVWKVFSTEPLSDQQLKMLFK